MWTAYPPGGGGGETDHNEVALAALKDMVQNKMISYACFGDEICPKTKRDHQQGYMEIPAKKTMVGVKRMFTHANAPWFANCHLDLCKGTPEQCVVYTAKDGKWWEVGDKMVQGRRSDLTSMQQAIDKGADDVELAEMDFGKWCQYRRSFAAYRELKRVAEARKTRKQKPHVEVHWGDAGTGKSKHVAELIGEKGADWVSAKNGFILGYTGKAIVVFDDFRTEDMDEQVFLRLTDRYPVQVNVKGSSMHWNPTTIYLTSNTPPEGWWRGKPQVQRRIDVVRMWTQNDSGSGSPSASIAGEVPRGFGAARRLRQAWQVVL